MKLSDFHVGDKVYLVDFHYNYNCSFENATVEEVSVVSVGKKYVTVKCDDFGAEQKFYVNNEWEEYLTQKVETGRANWLFRSTNDYSDYIEKQVLIRVIRNAVGCIEHCPVDDLRKIRDILKGAN